MSAASRAVGESYLAMSKYSRLSEGTLCAAGFTITSVSLRLYLLMARYYSTCGSDHKLGSRYHDHACLPEASPFLLDECWRSREQEETAD